jgi:hypothetical protein
MRHAFCVAFVLALGFASAPAAGHPHHADDRVQGPPGHDRPGPPPIVTEVDISTVTHPNMDDGGGVAEVMLSIGIRHQGHGSVYPVISEPNLDFGQTGGTWQIGRVLYFHRECTPMEPIEITIEGVEFDASNLDEVERMLLNAAASLTELATGIDGTLLSTIVAGVLSVLNPDDSLGSGSVTANGPGTYSVATSGGDYSITAEFIVSTTEVPGTDCDPEAEPPVVPPPGVCVIGTTFFDSLFIALPEVDEVQLEAGNPSGIALTDLEDAKTALRSLVIDMARWAAIRMIQRAWGYQGALTAWGSYQQGLQEGVSHAALVSFKSALCQAHAAYAQQIPEPGPIPMPVVTAAAPSMIATTSGSTATYLIGAFGDQAHGATIASVTGGPPGAGFTLEPADPAHPSAHYLHVSQAGPPGVWPIHVNYETPSPGAQATAPLPPLALTLDIAPPGVSTVDDPPGGRPVAFAVRWRGANPVRDPGMLEVDLPRAADLTLALFDVAGQRVIALADREPREAGRHRFALDTRSLRSGVYYARLTASPREGGSSALATSGKIVVLR